MIKIYVLTMGKNLYYATEDEEDAEYEKETAESENPLGRKQGIQIYGVEVDTEDPDSIVHIGKMEFKAYEILDLL